MKVQIKRSTDKIKTNEDENLSTTTVLTEPVNPVIDINPQVKPAKQYAPRRSYDDAYKKRVLALLDACTNGAERSALLRREGLYYSRICAWRKEELQGKLKNKSGKNKPRTDHLTAEIVQLKKKLAQAEAIIDLQKKVSELFGLHTHKIDSNEVS
jgi:transposase